MLGFQRRGSSVALALDFSQVPDLDGPIERCCGNQMSRLWVHREATDLLVAELPRLDVLAPQVPPADHSVQGGEEDRVSIHHLNS